MLGYERKGRRPLRPAAQERTIYIGVDPGKTGGLVALLRHSTTVTQMPTTERDTWEWFKQVVGGSQRVVAVIELVGGYMGKGTEAPGSAMFKFGRGYGNLTGFMTATERISYEEVPPHVWQRALGIPPRKKGNRRPVVNKKGKTVVKMVGGESKSQWKNRLKAKAQQLFPSVEVTLATADALLIALYCKRKYEGTLG